MDITYKGWKITYIKKGELYRMKATSKFCHLYDRSKVLDFFRIKRKIDMFFSVRKGYYPSTFNNWWIK